MLKMLKDKTAEKRKTMQTLNIQRTTMSDIRTSELKSFKD